MFELGIGPPQHVEDPCAAAQGDCTPGAGQQILDEFAAVASESGATRIRKAVQPGDPAGTILRYSGEHDVDLIVMGSRGLGDVESMLLGSVSRKVANLSKVACLTVK